MSQQADNSYYVPHGTRWPIIGSLGMITMLASAAYWMNGSGSARWTFILGVAIIIYMLFGWFGEVIRESERRQIQLTGRVFFPARHGLVYFFRNHVFRMFFWRPVLCTCTGCAVAGRRRRRCQYQRNTCGRDSLPHWPTNGPAGVWRRVSNHSRIRNSVH